MCIFKIASRSPNELMHWITALLHEVIKIWKNGLYIGIRRSYLIWSGITEASLGASSLAARRSLSRWTCAAYNTEPKHNTDTASGIYLLCTGGLFNSLAPGRF